MSKVNGLYSTSLGKKAAMAVSGLLLFGFVLGHMAGNLKMYQGQVAYDHYAEGLRVFGAPFLPHGGFLWIARLGLLAAVAVHIASAWQTSRQSRAARSTPYAKQAVVQADYAVRTMRWGGVIILLFVIYHLCHLTWGVAHPDFQAGSVYHNVVTGFNNPLVSLVYIAANVALGFHLYHGLWSFFQSLGLNHPRYNAGRATFARVFAFLITAGNLSFPIAVLTGVVA